MSGKLDWNLLIGWVAIGCLMLAGIWMVTAMGRGFEAKCCPCECSCVESIIGESDNDGGFDFSSPERRLAKRGRE